MTNTNEVKTNPVEEKIEIKHGVAIVEEQETKTKKNNKVKSESFKKFNRYVVNKLNTKQALKQEWIIVSVISLIFVIFFGTLLGIMQRFSTMANGTYPAIYNARHLNEAMRIMSIISFSLLVVPYIYMAAAFFSGINQIYKSKTVHYIIWSTFILNGLMLLTCCFLLIAGYYGLDGYNLGHNIG